MNRHILKYLFFLLVFTASLSLVSQKSVLIVDLEQRLSSEQSPEIIVKIYLDLAHLYTSIEKDLALSYAEKALLLSKTTRSIEDKINALKQIGKIEFSRGNYDDAMEYFSSALDINKEISNLREIAKCDILIGDVYKKIGDKRRAKREYEKALEIGVKTKNSNITALANFSLGKLREYLGDKQNALELITLSNEQVNEQENLSLKAEICRSIGQLTISVGDMEKGIDFLNSSLRYYVTVDSSLYNGVSSNQAELNYEIAKAYETLEDNPNFQLYMEKSLALSKKLVLKNYIIKGYKNLSKAYELNKDYRKAYEYLQYYANIKGVSEINFLESQLELTKKEQELSLVREKQYNEEKIKTTRTIFFSLILLILLVFSSFLLYAYRQKISINKELEIATFQSNKLRQDKEDFFAYTSHEIRTPLNAVVGLSHLMAQTNLSGKQKDYLSTIKNSANNILFLVNDILDLSKIEKGAILLEKVPFSLQKIITDIEKSVSFKLTEKNVEIISSIDADVPEILVGDPMRINQILLNLVDNAIKFTKKGSVKISVSKNKSESSNSLFFCISDTGIGIEKEKLESIFDSYEQASTQTTRQYGGTGLGLAITKELVRLMGGKIKVKSSIGKGSDFSFSLNLKAGKKEDLPLQLPNYENFNFENLSILLVDDNELNRIVLNEIIKNFKEEIVVSFAEDGQVAVNMIEKENFDLILMDLQMPKMDGYEASKYIRTKLPEHKKNIPIIAMTAHVVDGVAQKCFDSGMNDCLSKPIKTELLFNKIATILALEPKKIKVEKTKIFNGIHKKNKNVTNLSFLTKISKGDHKKIEKYISIYLQTVPTDLKELQIAVNDKNFKALSSVAHKLKGNASYLGVEDVLSELNELEKMKHFKENTNEITNIVDKVSLIIEQSISELNNYILELNKQ